MFSKLDYNGENDELVATFKGGAQYLYAGVPLDVYMGVVGAESVGREFNAKIKAGSYEFAKLEKAELNAQGRAIEEEQQLADRVTSLNEFIGTEPFNALDEETQDELNEQLGYMMDYQRVLQVRLISWK